MFKLADDDRRLRLDRGEPIDGYGSTIHTYIGSEWGDDNS